jgi:uncharacterized low-complexity protein
VLDNRQSLLNQTHRIITMISKKTLALGAAFAASVSLSTAGFANEAPFGATAMETGYTLAEKDAEGKCGGEGKCGSDMKKKEGACGADMKKKEGSCGADMKKKEGTCGADMKKKEGSCGADMKKKEGSCGADMKKKEG